MLAAQQLRGVAIRDVIEYGPRACMDQVRSGEKRLRSGHYDDEFGWYVA
jgi:hypothetical protein